MIKPIIKGLYTALSAVLLFIPFLFATIDHQISQIDILPVSALNTGFFFSVMKVTRPPLSFFKQPINTVLYTIAVSLIIFTARVFLSSKVLRSMISFYKHSVVKVIPGIIISTISLSLYVIAIYQSGPFSTFKSRIPWFNDYYLVLSMFFLALALYFTSENLIKKKLTIKKSSLYDRHEKMGFLLFCNIIYSVYLTVMLYFFYRYFFNYSRNNTLLIKENLLFITLFTLLFFFFSGFVLGLLNIAERKRFPFAGFLLALLSLLFIVFFVDRALANNEKDWSELPVLNQARRFVIIGKDTIIYQYPRIDVLKNLNTCKYGPDKANLTLLRENLLSAGDLFSYGLNTRFSLKDDWLPKLLTASPELNSAMMGSLNDPMHNLRSAFHLIYYLLLFNQDVPHDHPLISSSLKIHDTALTSCHRFPRDLTPKALRIIEMLDHRKTPETFMIRGKIDFEENIINTGSADMFISIMNNKDFEYVSQDISSGNSPVDMIWKFCGPFIRLDDSSFEFEAVLDGGASYRFIILIDDISDTLGNISDIRTNLYNIEISSGHTDEYRISLNPIKTEISDDENN